MKLNAKKWVYNASNVRYEVNTQAAWSYDWWQFVKRIDNLLVFNTHKYSPTTQRHQRKVRELMERLGHSATVYVDIREGLQGINSAAELYAKVTSE